MINRGVFWVLFCALLLGFSGTTQAEIIISIDNVETTADSTVVVGVFAHSTSGAQLFSYDTPIDIGGDGAGTPDGLTLTDVVEIQDFDSFSNLGGSSQEDLLVSVGSFATATTISGDALNPTLLYNLEFAVDDTVSVGQVFDLDVITGNGFAGGVPSFVILDETFANVTGSPVNGSITITAVPEPAAASLFALVAMVGMTVRRRR